MSEPFIGMVVIFAGNFAPRGWAFCQGQMLPIAQNTALFSLLGTSYGGDGRVTFGLPDLRGRVAIGIGQGPGLPNVNIGELAGAPSHTLTSGEMPSHNHLVSANANGATSKSPANTVPAFNEDLANFAATTSGAVMLPSMIAAAGSNQPHNNLQPYLGIGYIIALQGIYPSRN